MSLTSIVLNWFLVLYANAQFFSLAHQKIVRACGLALRNYETNSAQANHCIVKLLHRIAFDCKMYSMVFQASIFRSFQKIYEAKDMPQFKVLSQFSFFLAAQCDLMADHFIFYHYMSYYSSFFLLLLSTKGTWEGEKSTPGSLVFPDMNNIGPSLKP